MIGMDKTERGINMTEGFILGLMMGIFLMMLCIYLFLE